MYIDAFYDRKNEIIRVTERRNGVRHLVDYNPVYRSYYEDPKGKYRSIFQDPLSKIECRSAIKYRAQITALQKRGVRLFESDINPIFKCLEENYLGAETPTPRVAFLDIETDFDPERGYAGPWEPFAPITAITVVFNDEGQPLTLALLPSRLKPDGTPFVSYDEGLAICQSIPNTVLFTDEREMLDVFLQLIEDADILSGWNSDLFDIPYLVNRVERVLGGRHTSRFCLWGQSPRPRTFIKYGREQKSYDLIGRVHLDYLVLYSKHNTQQLHSYRLDYVGQFEELGKKVEYPGSLDQLYHNDFKLFIEYNRQDTYLLYLIDRKKRYIDLSNQIAHTNCVLFKTTTGSVALIEQAITLEAHSRNLFMPDRPAELDEDADRHVPELAGEDDDEEEIDIHDGKAAVGAYVARPKVGLIQWLAAIDLNSLYPSCMRSLNMSTETLIGQIRQDMTTAEIRRRLLVEKVKKSEAWDGLFAALEYDEVIRKTDQKLVVDMVDGSTIETTGRELADLIFHPNSKIVISANGTLFTREREGVIPSLLSRWYAERKTMQGKEKRYQAMLNGRRCPAIIQPIASDVEVTEYDVAELESLVNRQDSQALTAFILNNGLEFDGQYIKPTAANGKTFSYWQEFWGMRQLARKILLNSLYGALLNTSCRMYDVRLGQSVTLTGRSIARHMNASTNEQLTGEYDYRGACIQYSDTDSCYFSAMPVLNDPTFKERWPDFTPGADTFIALYDEVAKMVNRTFPIFMHEHFNTTIEKGKIIAAGREIVASMGYFIKKKKYACLMIDKEGTRYDVAGKPGKIKAMGLDLKRADTPIIMQKFLEEILTDVLTGKDKDYVFDKIKNFRHVFRQLRPWEQGVPRKVNNLTGYREALGERDENLLSFKKRVKEKRITVPGHVRAAMTWNQMVSDHHDHYSQTISDGGKIVVCYLRPNPTQQTAVAYPIDQPHLPDWFKELPFDVKKMENTIVDNKIKNLLEVLGWNLIESSDKNFFLDLL